MNYIAILEHQVRGIAAGLVAILPNLVIGLIVLFITWLVSRFAVRIADRVVGTSKLRENLKQLVETLVKLGIWLIGLLIAAAIMIPGFTPAGMIAGLGIGAVAIGFAFQDIFEAFLAGVLLMLRDKMKIGDSIEVNGIMGTVEKVTLRETYLRQFSGELTIMPNSMLFKNAVMVFTDQSARRDEVMVRVSYDTDLDQAMEAIRRALDGVEHLAQDKPLGIYAREFGASSMDILVQWWADTSVGDLREIHTQVVLAIKRELDKAEIEIPFPYVTHTFKEEVPVPALAALGQPEGKD